MPLSTGPGEDVETQFKQLSVIPSTNEYTKNCVVIEDIEALDVETIIRHARGNEAWENNSDEEAGDDLYAVQFPGHQEELLNQDQIAGRLREAREESEE